VPTAEDLKVEEIPKSEHVVPAHVFTLNPGLLKALEELAGDTGTGSSDSGLDRYFSIVSKPRSGGRRIMGPYIKHGTIPMPETYQTDDNAESNVAKI